MATTIPAIIPDTISNRFIVKPLSFPFTSDVPDRGGRLRFAFRPLYAPRPGPVPALGDSESGARPFGKFIGPLLECVPDLTKEVRGEAGRLAALASHRAAKRGGGQVDGLVQQRPVYLPCQCRPPSVTIRPIWQGQYGRR